LTAQRGKLSIGIGMKNNNTAKPTIARDFGAFSPLSVATTGLTVFTREIA
jgi:hypothetical protein